MSRVGAAIEAAVAVSLLAGITLLLAPGHAGFIGHVWLVVVLALALGTALGRLRRALPRRRSAFETVFDPRVPTRARPASLARAERDVTLATGTAFDAHVRLRPHLREITAGLLLRRGIDLERRPDRARELLGPAVWALVRPDVEPPEDRGAPGVPLAAIERALDDLERLAWS